MDEKQLDVLKQLKALGVKRAVFHSLDRGPEVFEVEFFPSIAPLDLDTLVPPPDPEEDPSRAEPVPRAIANILKRGSVS